MSQTTAQLLGPVKNNVTGDIIFDSHTLFVDESTNRVGVNTQQPASPLHVNGNVAFGDGGGFDMNVIGTRCQFSINGSEKLRITSTGQLQAISASDVRLTLGSTGTAGTNDSVHIRGDGSSLKFMAASGGETIFETNGNESFRISSAGNVGINRNNPNQRLNVNGNIEVNAYDNAGGGNGYYTAKGLIIGNMYDAGKSYTGSDDRTGIIWQERGLDLDFATNDTYRMKLTYDGKLIISHTQRATPFLAADGGICIEQDYDGNLYGLAIRNKDTTAAASTGIVFSLDRSSGSSQDFAGGSITLHKEQEWTSTSSTVGGQLKLSTIYQGTLRGRLLVGGGGLISNVKGGNTQYAGSTILGMYKYVQTNQGSGHQHNILGADGRNLNVYLNNNVGAHIYVKVTGTGTMTSYCEYYYENNSSVSSATLTHIRGNSSGSSNRPYMGLSGQIPYWTMAHSGNYTIDVMVQMMGGRTYSSYQQAAESAYTSNP